MNYKLLALMILLPAGVLRAHDGDDRLIREASELRDWCKAAAEAELLGRGGTPSNWSARYWDAGNTLNVEGQLRSGEERWTAQCQIVRNAQARFATLSLNQTS